MLARLDSDFLWLPSFLVRSGASSSRLRLFLHLSRADLCVFVAVGQLLPKSRAALDRGAIFSEAVPVGFGWSWQHVCGACPARAQRGTHRMSACHLVQKAVLQ